VEDRKDSQNYRLFTSHKTTGPEEDFPEEEDSPEEEDTLEEAHPELDPLVEDGDWHQFNCHNPKQENWWERRPPSMTETGRTRNFSSINGNYTGE